MALTGPELLTRLDRAVWVSKRLFPSRILALDEVESNQDSERFVKGILATVARDSERTYLQHPLKTLAVDSARKWAAAVSSGPNRNSAFQQFLADLGMYGLREAIGYLAEYPALSLSEAEIAGFVVGYHTLGTRFLARQDEVKKNLREWLRARSPLALFDVEVAGDIWGDGQPQTNHARGD